MTSVIPAAAHRLFEAKTFATIATLLPSGQPHLSVVWIARDGADLLVSTVEGRRKHRNLSRDPRCTVLMIDPDDPYTYLEVRGTAAMTTAGGRELIDALARHYRGIPRYTADDGTDHVRVVVRISPNRVVWRTPPRQ